MQILRIRVLQRTDDCVKQKIHLLLIFLNERFCTFRANKREKCIFSRKCTKYRFWQVYFLLFVMLKKVNYFVEPIIKKILMWCKKDWELKKTSLQIHFTSSFLFKFYKNFIIFFDVFKHSNVSLTFLYLPNYIQFFCSGLLISLETCLNEQKNDVRWQNIIRISYS